MAHTVFLTRGEYTFHENFIKELSTTYVPMNIYNKETKALQRKLLKLRLCPIMLWDLSYPKEHRDVIHNTIFSGTLGEGIHKRHRKFLWPLKKAMKLDDIKEYDKSKRLMMNNPEHVEVIGIGVKDDYWIEPDDSHTDEKHKSDLAQEGI